MNRNIFLVGNVKHLVGGTKCLVHTSAVTGKYFTNTELVHRRVKYGLTAIPLRPNDPRVPSNSAFGKTYLDNMVEVSNEPTADEKVFDEPGRKKRGQISTAMKVYLERARKHNELIKHQEDEFQDGRRHLANIMGVNETDMTQHDINLAIQYLMPSGLFDPRARPILRPPKEIIPAIKEAQFSSDGRPYHTFFYTSRPNFFQTTYDIEEEYNRLKDYEDEQHRLGIFKPPSGAELDLPNSAWLTHKELKLRFLEKLEEKRYEGLIQALENLMKHPYSKLAKDFILKYRKEIISAVELLEIPPLKHDENGRPYMNAVGSRKFCIAHVTVRGNGTGKVDINGKDILYFSSIQDREQIMTPLKFCGLLHKVDIECRTTYEELTKEWSEDVSPFWPRKTRELGTSSQSGAIRHALSLALKSFVDKETVEKMRLCGLLSHDGRKIERKKWGQEGARRKFTWKKR